MYKRSQSIFYTDLDFHQNVYQRFLYSRMQIRIKKNKTFLFKIYTKSKILRKKGI